MEEEEEEEEEEEAVGFQDLSRCWSDCLLKAFSLSSPSSLLPSSGSVAVVSVVSFRATLLSASISLSDHRRVVFILWHIHSRRPFFSAFLQLFCLKTFIGFESFILLLFWLIVFFFFFFFYLFFFLYKGSLGSISTFSTRWFLISSWCFWRLFHFTSVFGWFQSFERAIPPFQTVYLIIQVDFSGTLTSFMVNSAISDQFHQWMNVIVLMRSVRLIFVEMFSLLKFIRFDIFAIQCDCPMFQTNLILLIWNVWLNWWNDEP